ncbi:RNA polymerase sigma factor SigZ [Aliamphritea ceti]|uniref:RNA polymerase sigma factor SigZ n=1 Tax=Aliamphritea ceti TaxID=1524258 RepID=UPI0021C34B33|nr:RNA polymerase sigma factor SigZ [Aliamphritea ceti]
MTIDALWSEYQADIKAYLHSKVSNPDDVEELLQEISLRAFLNLNTLKSEEKTKAWLFKIAGNMVIDFYRKNSNKRLNPHPEDLWYLDQSEDVEHVFSRCVAPLIRDLPDDMAALLTAIDIKGHSQKEYAADIGISYSTLKSRVQKARKMLYAVFNEYCDISVDRRGNILDFNVNPEKYERCKTLLPICLPPSVSL